MEAGTGASLAGADQPPLVVALNAGHGLSLRQLS